MISEKKFWQYWKEANEREQYNCEEDIEYMDTELAAKVMLNYYHIASNIKQSVKNIDMGVEELVWVTKDLTKD